MPFHDAAAHLDAIFRAGLQRVDPYRMILDHVRLEDGRLIVDMETERHAIDLAPYARIFILGTGKATAPMARAFEAILGERITKGLIVVKYGHTAPLERVAVMESAHPVPDERGVAGARALLDLAHEADAATLVITLVSGGGSALVPAPIRYTLDGQETVLTLEDKQGVTRALLRCGANINEINCIRKHLSGLKGGRLLQHIAPARSVNFILSDVIGDDLSSIASGLTAPDPTTFADALGIIEKYGIAGEISEAVLATLQRGLEGRIPETLKKDAAEAALTTNILLGTNTTALAAAGEMAESLGYNLVCLTSRITGDAGEVARMLAAVAADTATAEMLARKPCCILSGGEPVVHVTGSGKGGRNQEMALVFLAEIEKRPDLFGDVAFLAASTDGNDGPTDAAGAFASLAVLAEAAQAGLSLRAFLRDNDSYHFFDAIGRLYKTGPTNTNVCDLHIILVR
ncbi:MAG: glycerate kinase [Desulfovibrionaceae bacterium]